MNVRLDILSRAARKSQSLPIGKKEAQGTIGDSEWSASLAADVVRTSRYRGGGTKTARCLATVLHDLGSCLTFLVNSLPITDPIMHHTGTNDTEKGFSP